VICGIGDPGRQRDGAVGDAGLLDPVAEVGPHIGVVQRLGVGEAHVGAIADHLDAALLEIGGAGVLEHDLVAALAVHLVGGDVQVEELALVLGEPVAVGVDEHGVLLPVDARDL
jgi:hypothetical protein